MAELPLRSKEVLNDLFAIISKDNNYGTYREVLRFSATPCVPFLGRKIRVLNSDFV